MTLRSRVVSHFDAGDWEEAGPLSGESTRIDQHPRLLRSLSWGDEDYEGNVLTVLRSIAETNRDGFVAIERFTERKYPGDDTFVSAKPSERRLAFAPHVFHIPDRAEAEPDLVALMMPFAAEFNPVHQAVKTAASETGLRCLRVDDIWEDSVTIQDVFSLILRARAVVVDFTGRNPNVMYETGIAHTLGKLVVPLSQSTEDVPFDIAHHRVLKYYANDEGLAKMTKDLQAKLSQL